MRKSIAVAISVIMLLTGRSCVYAKDRVIEKLEITSSAFKEGGIIPKRYSGYGDNVSPDIMWSKAPIGTKCIAIICEDPDAVTGVWTHWVIYNIPNKLGALPEKIPPHEALPDGSLQGINDFKKTGYDGPHPPYGTHRYFFRVYALDTRLNLDRNVTKDELLHAMEGNLLAEGSLMGRYSK